jgi:hypothetical protein
VRPVVNLCAVVLFAGRLTGVFLQTTTATTKPKTGLVWLRAGRDLVPLPRGDSGFHQVKFSLCFFSKSKEQYSLIFSTYCLVFSWCSSLAY